MFTTWPTRGRLFGSRTGRTTAAERDVRACDRVALRGGCGARARPSSAPGHRRSGFGMVFRWVSLRVVFFFFFTHCQPPPRAPPMLTPPAWSGGGGGGTGSRFPSDGGGRDRTTQPYGGGGRPCSSRT